VHRRLYEAMPVISHSVRRAILPTLYHTPSIMSGMNRPPLKLTTWEMAEIISHLLRDGAAFLVALTAFFGFVLLHWPL
jgi:hypothetical protein